jgi:hypothetical protein
VSTEEMKALERTANERYPTMSMLASCDKSSYSKLTEDLENDLTKGSNLYNTTITESYNLIVNYRQSNPSRRIFNDSEGIAFNNVKTTRSVPDITKVKSYNCNKKGHYSNEYPDTYPEKAIKNALASTMTVADEAGETECYEAWEEFNTHQSNQKFNQTWILLDNCSTNIF